MIWIKTSERIHELIDTNGNVVHVVEDRTCNGNSVTQVFLDECEQEYLEQLKEQERENEQ
jgi:folate-dependent phosphoribosylglycinamide formyltransferase PurN